MKLLFTSILFLIFCLNIVSAQTSNPNFNDSLFQTYKGDNYGMKSYFLVILKTGSNSTQDQEFIRTQFAGHMRNMDSLVARNQLVVAGPFQNNDQNFRGIFIMQNLNSVEEVHLVLQNDPAIHSQLLSAIVLPWYGSAALPAYLPIADQIWKSKP